MPGFIKGAVLQALLLLATAAIPAVGTGVFHPKRPAWSAAALAPGETDLLGASAFGERVLWVDARPAAEFEAGHIPGAVRLEGEGWDELLPAVLDQWEENRVIVVYCSSQSCRLSHEVADRLREEVGLEPVYVLKGGWEAWKEANR